MTRKPALRYALFLMLGVLIAVAGLQAASLDPVSEWTKSKHNNVNTTLLNATVEARGATAAHCGRCHSATGYIAWQPQLAAGNPGLIAKPDGSPADVPYLTSLGLTKDKAQPVTCNACHGNDFALRWNGNTPLLPAGFKVERAGKGALCMTCHNTRNGRINWYTDDPGRYTMPHEAAQTDMLVGKNAYFIDDTDRPSKHALFTADTCVQCHKILGKEGHTFQPAENVCTNCHGPSMKPEFVQKATTELHDQLRVAIEKRVLAMKSQIGLIVSWDPVTDKDTPNFVMDGNQIKRVDILSIHGQAGFQFTMADNKILYSQVNNIRLNVLGLPGNQIFLTADPVVRASWNYLLVEYDGSKGVHNPTFARDMMLATIKALQ